MHIERDGTGYVVHYALADVPGWVVAALSELPDTMIESGRRANQYENAIVDLCEADPRTRKVAFRLA